MNQKIFILSRSLFTLFGIFGSLRVFKKFQRYMDIFFYQKINKIPLTISESKEYLSQNPQSKYLLLTGHILPANQTQTRFLKLECILKNKQEFQVDEFQLLDAQHNQRKNIKINRDSILLPELVDYQKTYSYQKESFSLIQKILNKLPFFNKQSKIIETHKGTQFGQFTTMLCKRNGENLNLLYLSNQNYDKIFLQLQRDIINFASLVQILTSFGAIAQLIYFFVKQWQEKQNQNQQAEAIPPNLNKKSVSTILNSQNEQDICVVCLSKTRSIILEPCLHFIVCQDCVDHLDKQICPFCRIKIEKKIKVLYD
ncbi:unnamed protein product [Paramecium sonneborni]|uniref:RING-type domain-containing protein n=1 Tax=Paramecium sonneborni TaxID=65129 RepID=A0A8S1LEA2_9CILI|nr:unnamed protein product [Paramecium sonneborni]